MAASPSHSANMARSRALSFSVAAAARQFGRIAVEQFADLERLAEHVDVELGDDIALTRPAGDQAVALEAVEGLRLTFSRTAMSFSVTREPGGIWPVTIIALSEE